MSSIFPPGCTDSQCWDHSLGQGGIVCLSQAKWESSGPPGGCINYGCYNMLAKADQGTSLCYGMDLYLISAIQIHEDIHILLTCRISIQISRIKST